MLIRDSGGTGITREPRWLLLGALLLVGLSCVVLPRAGVVAAEGGYPWAVQVLAYRDDDLLNQVSGTVVGAPAVVVTSRHIVRDADRIVAVLAGGEQVPLQVKAEYSADGLVLLGGGTRLPSPAPLASSGVARGDSVTSAGYWQGTKEPSRGFRLLGPNAPDFKARRQSGQVTEVGVVQGVSDGVVTHVTPLGRGGYGSALINRCGQLVGVNLPPLTKSDDELWHRHVPDARFKAVAVQTLETLLQQAGSTTTRVDTPCGTDAGGVASGAAPAKAAVGGTTSADKAKRDADKARKRAAEAEKKAKDAREEADRAKQKADQLQEQQQQLKEDSAKQAEALAETLASKDEQVQQSESKLQAQWKLIAGIVAAGVILLLLGLFVLRKRKRALHETEAELVDLTAPRPDFVFTGQDSSGAPLAFRVSGSDLHQSPAGLLLGRNPSSAQVVVADPSVSRVHAKLSLDNDQLLIEDYGSSVGTTVNGQSLTASRPLALHDGDELGLGDASVRLTIEDPRA